MATPKGMTSLPASSRRQLQRQAFLAKWSKVDWSKQNGELAAETGLNRERIRQIRQQVGAPKATHHGRWRKTVETLQWAKDNLDKLKGLSATELGRKYGLTLHWQNGSLYSFLKPFLRDDRLMRKRRWDLMNFRLPNPDLERIWRLPRKAVGNYRYDNQRPPSEWNFRCGPGCTKLSKPGQTRAYQRAVKAEERKAAKYFAQARVAARKPSPTKIPQQA